MDCYQSCHQRAELDLEYELLYTNEKHYNIRIRIITQVATFQVKVQTEGDDVRRLDTGRKRKMKVQLSTSPYFKCKSHKR